MSHSYERNPRRSAAVLICALVIPLFLAACQGHFDRDDHDEEEHAAQPAHALAQISVEKGQTVIQMGLQTQQRLGIEATALVAVRRRLESSAPATVLPVESLVNLRNGFVALQAQVEKSRVETDTARKEYARLKTLFGENQNISQKALQSAETAVRSDEADLQAAEQQLNLQKSIARQQWGIVVARWVMQGSPELQQVLDQKKILVQLTLPSGSKLQAPGTISVEATGGSRTDGKLVSAFPRIDPRIQGAGFLYIAAWRPGYSPGANLLAHLAVGPPVRGVVVPARAVVWLEGEAWVYEQTAPDRFARWAVTTDVPTERGYFVSKTFAPGEKVVTRGAQDLLSEEAVLQGQTGGEGDED